MFFQTKCKGVFEIFVTACSNALSWWIMGASDRTIVSYIMGTAANGLLSVSHKFSSAYTTFYTVFNLSWTESASLHFHDEDHEIFFESVISKVYRLFSAACLGIIALMPLVFPILLMQIIVMHIIRYRFIWLRHCSM